MRFAAALAAAALATLSLAQGDLWLRGPDTAFRISGHHGNLVAGLRNETPIIGASNDVYWWVTDDGKTLLDESNDLVIHCEASAERVQLVCRVPHTGLTIRKEYWLVAGGRALAKRVTVPVLQQRGMFRVRSSVTLVESFRQGSWYYCQRQSWSATPDRNLFGVRRAADITEPIVSGAGWDPRLVVAFNATQAVGHYRLAVRGQYVPPSSVMGAWATAFEEALRYTPTGWDFELLHTLDGEPSPVDATAVYHFCDGDLRDLWREYRELPEFRQTMDYLGPEWVNRVALGSFWHPDPLQLERQAQDAHRLAERLGEGTLPLGVFAWSLDGDYETDAPFLNEIGTLIMTPEYFGRSIDTIQADPRVKVGTYFQGGLIDSDSGAFREHPEWAMQTREGKPFFSGFRDNPLGEMYFFNVLSPFADHFLRRVQAVCKRYHPGWIYLDGGAMFESTDWRLRRPILPDDWMRFHRRLRETIRSTDPDCALLMNAQNMPFADLYWLECGYFSPSAAWRDTVEFCYDSEIHHEPARAMLPLYWQDEARYLAMCVAFGFTPTSNGVPPNGDFSEAQWRAIDAANWMRPGRLVLKAGAVSPDFLREETDVVAFAEQLPGWAVVPVLSMGEAQQVTIALSLADVGLPPESPQRVQLARPLETAEMQDLGRVGPRDGILSVPIRITPGWKGLTLLVVGDADLPLGRLPVTKMD
ncbi:MAG: hypothetical protein HPY44_13075 [Armatimonadetes bacterium]|nr:hypothetical protein [Armatimonadota bacterium]